MPTIECTNAVYLFKINGVDLQVDFTKMHPTYVDYFLLKAAQRRLNDDFNTMEPANKLEAIIRELQVIHSGEAMPEKTRKARGMTVKDDRHSLIMEYAREELVVRFRKANKIEGKAPAKIADLAKHPAVAAYFTEKDGKFTWVTEKVVAFVARQLAEGGRDFAKEADEYLARIAEAGESVTDDDLGF